MSLDNDGMIGLRTYDENTIPCRDCVHAIKGGIGKGFCRMYELKPLDVYFEVCHVQNMNREKIC